MPLPFVPGCEGVGVASDRRVVLVYGIGVTRHGTYAEMIDKPVKSVFELPVVYPDEAAGLGLPRCDGVGANTPRLG